MDKETLSNYGWIVICVLVLAVMLALSSPFGSFVATGVKSTTQGLFDTNQKALNTTGLISVESQDFNGSIFRNATIPADGTYTVKATGDVLSAGEKFPDAPATGDIYEEGDYEYRYNCYYSYNSWNNKETQNGWGVRVKDTTKSAYGEIISEIAGKPVSNMTYSFYNCASLTVAPTIPNSVTNMSNTFNNCTKLTTAPTIPNGVTVMNCTFWNCTSLTTAPTIPNSVTSMYHTFYNCISLTIAPVIPGSVKNMCATFINCTNLTTAPTIPDNVTDMSFTFQGCTSLTTAPTIPNKVTNMSSTFNGCKSLKTYVGSTDADGDFSNYQIPNSVTNMAGTFWNCSKLTTAPTIPSKVSNMNSTFRGCTSLTGTIEINANPTSYTYYFLGTTKPITLTGTSSKLNDIASQYSNVTVATTP